VWKRVHMMKIGRTVLALEEPLGDALAIVEAVPDEPLAPEGVTAPPAAQKAPGDSSRGADGSSERMGRGPVAAVPTVSSLDGGPPPRRRSGWSATDILVMTAGLSVLGLSLAGLIWLLRG
jgi:hypothetical protein